MLDQMFTSENFRRIYDAENRKGVDLATRYFPTLNSFTLAVRNKAQDIRSLRKIESTLTSDDFNPRLLALKDELSSLKAQKSEAIDSLMDDISQKVLTSSFKINLSQKTGPKGKPVFCIDAEPETFFVIKQLQRNIHRIYGVKQANRHDLVSQVRDMISNRFPFELVRTDISSFYETIDRKKLIEKLDSDQLLSPASKKYIKQILASYGKISGTINGVPRGVGVSAYLAELYLRTIDNAIRSIPGLALYCRYVDDILAIFARPPEGNGTGSYKDQIITIFGKSGLTHNVTKTSEFNLANSNPVEFEYLGYLFNLTNKVLKIGPSTAKVDKYRSRMKAAFNAYEQQRPINPKIAYRELLSRIRFLTGNTRLSNSKAQAVTGIYFNNSISNDYSSFDQLDSELKLLVNGLKSTSLQKKLKKLKFATGFKERRYHSFSTRDLQMIVRAWKNV